MSCLLAITEHLPKILGYSGRGLFKIGEYANCIIDPDMDFKMVELNSPENPLLMFYQGLCLPKECKGAQIGIIIEDLIKKYNLPFNLSTVKENFPQFSYEYGIGFYLTIIFISILLILFCLASTTRTLQSHSTLSAFSLKNTLKIFQYKDNPLNTLNGVRSLAMMWVIFGHQYALVLGQISNVLNLPTIAQNWIFLLVEAGLFAVDTFFFIGGFLVAYAFLKQSHNSNYVYPLAILNRFLRFFPNYLLALLIYSSVINHLGTGPFWEINMIGTTFCSALWKPLLYLDNLIGNGQTMCMSWGWYLQNDMQLFIVCILILVVYKKNKFLSFLFTFMCLVISWAFNMHYTYNNSTHTIITIADQIHWGSYFFDLYIKPYGRCAPYLFGLLLGISYTQFLGDQKNIEKKHWLSRLKKYFQVRPQMRRIWEIFGITLGSFIVFIPRTAQIEDDWPQIIHSVYLTYGKTAFVFSLSIILLPSLLGIESIVRFCMDTKFFNCIAKISFWTYLIHLSIIYQWFGAINTDEYFSIIPTYGLFASHCVSSMFFGLIFTVLMEVPCAKMQKKLINFLKKQIGQDKKRKTEEILAVNVTQAEQAMKI